MSHSRRVLLPAGLAVALSMGPAVARAAPQNKADPLARNNVNQPLVPGIVNLQELKKTKRADDAIPAPTMNTALIREALWDIAAQDKTLETRFLAAMSIADDNESWRALRELANDAPRFSWAHAGMAAVYSRWKLKDQCEKEINQAMELSSDLLWVYTIRGDLHRRLGDFAAAERDYVVALRGDPTDADARVGLALAKRAQGQTETLRSELEQALRDVPSHYEAAETLALLLDETNDPQALSAWERVAELSPRNRTAQLGIARLKASTDPAGAAAAFERASRGGPLTKTELEGLAKIYRLLNQPDDEIRALQSITKLDAKDTNALRRIAEIYAAKSEWNSAETALETLLGIAPNDAEAVIFMGRAAERRAQFRKAIEYFRRAQKIGSPAADKEVARISNDMLLPKKPIAGKNIDEFYANVMESLKRIYAKRLHDAPRLKGVIKLRIENNGRGQITDLEVSENELNDPWIEAHLYYAVLDSKFPPYDKRKFALPFELTPEAK
jgi:tetratricopeptide (TPR) repeat protein